MAGGEAAITSGKEGLLGATVPHVRPAVDRLLSAFPFCASAGELLGPRGLGESLAPQKHNISPRSHHFPLCHS